MAGSSYCILFLNSSVQQGQTIEGGGVHSACKACLAPPTEVSAQGVEADSKTVECLLYRNNMETTIVYWDYVGIMENKMESTTTGIRVILPQQQ